MIEQTLEFLVVLLVVVGAVVAIIGLAAVGAGCVVALRMVRVIDRIVRWFSWKEN